MTILWILAAILMAQDTTVARTVSGRITVDDGSPVPTVDTFRGPNVMVGLLATMPGTSSRISEATTRADGSFDLPLVLTGGSAEVAIHATRVPLAYYVKSIRYGSADLLRSSLLLTPTSSPTEVLVVLTKTPPADMRAFKVEGRVTNWNANSATPLTVSLQSNQPGRDGVSVLYLGTTRPKADGTYEFRGVPPGRYRGFTTPSGAGDLVSFDIIDRDVAGLEMALPPGAMSMIITGSPVNTLRITIRPSPEQVAGPAAPLVPPAGSAMVSISQSGKYGRKMYEGAVSLFRIEQSGIPLEEKRLEGSPLAFTIAPGSYELRGYSRGCDGNCGSLGEAEAGCTVPFKVAAGEVLYAERILQNGTCAIRFNAAPN